MKYSLTTIVVKGFCLLPSNELKIDLNIKDAILDSIELFDDNRVLIVTDIDNIEETIDVNKLPSFGTIALIKQKIKLPNGLFRLTLKGIKRANVLEYTNDETIEAIVEEKNRYELDQNEEKIILKKLNLELKEYINYIPYISNSFISDIKKITSIELYTDLALSNIDIDIKRKLEYQNEPNALNRAKMLLEDFNNQKEIYKVEQKLDIKLKKQIDDNQKEFLLREKMKLIKEELGDISSFETDLDKLKYELSKLNAPNNIKDKIKHEINRYSSMPPSSPEVNTERNYIECLLSLPWSEKTIDNDDLDDVRDKLNKTHNGIDKVKDRIIEYLGVKKFTNSLRGPILCLVGPPGVGKTTLAFSIAEAMNRNFVKISLGGVNDEAEIIGHRRTYLGASPGRIIKQMIKAKSSNPVFLIDEIDKMTTSHKGDPASVLLEVLDQNQNKYFKDNYVEEEYDLSKVMFIATANYINDIPEALLDRLEIINLSGYTEYEKLEIARKYLIPKICKEHGLNYNCLVINDNVLLNIIRHYTKEAGVRELERKISTIIRKVVTSLSETKISKNKITITNKLIEQYLGNNEFEYNKIKNNDIGVVNALAYTKYGGDILPIEVTSFKGKGEITLTGSLGSVMKESAIVALDYIKSNASKMDINYDDLINNDIHIHVPEGAINKDGPSAGIALTTALISLFKKQKIDNTVAFTGEITLKGDVLPIGGLKEKTIGALRSGIKKIYIPEENKKDLIELPKEVKENIEFILINNYKKLYKEVFK